MPVVTISTFSTKLLVEKILKAIISRISLYEKETMYRPLRSMVELIIVLIMLEETILSQFMVI